MQAHRLRLTSSVAITIALLGAAAQVSAKPRGSADMVYVLSNESEANDIPPGTDIAITLISETGTDLNTTATLAGTLAASTATALLEIPPGFSRFYLRVTFTPP